MTAVPYSDAAATGPVRFVPSLRACVRHYALVFGIGFEALFGIVVMADWLRGTPVLGPWEAARWAAVVALTSLAFAVLLALLVRRWNFSIHADGVEGRDVLGRRRRLAWDEIGTAAVFADQGARTVIASHRDRSRDVQVHMALLGIDAPAVAARLAATAGPGHPLTRVFAAN